MILLPKVAVITEIPTPYRQPVFQQIQKTSEFDIHFYFLSRSQRDREWKIKNIGIQQTFLEGRQICFRGYHTIHFNYDVQKKLLHQKFDLFVVGGYAQPTLWRVIRHCWVKKLPYIMITESHLRKKRSGLLQALKKSYLQKVYSQSAANLVMGKNSKEYVTFYGADPGNIFPFPNMVDVPSFRQEVDKLRKKRLEIREQIKLKDEQVLLFVGTMNRRKGIDHLIEVFASLQRKIPPTALLIVGTGSLEKEVREKVRVFGLEHRVHFLGFVQPKELPKYYAIADAFVLPSREEPFGAVVCEAMASGLPVVASSAVGAAMDYVEDGKSGLIFPAGDKNGLKSALGNILADPLQMKQMGEKSWTIMREWSHAKLASSFLQALKAANLMRA